VNRILFISIDLLYGSKITSVAERLNWPVQTVANTSQAIEAALCEEFALVLVDLMVPEIDITSLAVQLNALETRPRAIVAFGPHVDEQLLLVAQAAGCDQVLTRGQLNHDVQGVLSQYMG
jgi:CheY-like chemotaxis protein